MAEARYIQYLPGRALCARFFVTVALCVFGYGAFCQEGTDTVEVKHKGKKLKSAIRGIYKKLDSTKATHKYIQKINNLTNNVSGKYKKIDSLVSHDSGYVGKLYHAVLPAKQEGKTNKDTTAVAKNVSAETAKKVDKGPGGLKQEFEREQQLGANKGVNEYLTLGAHYLRLNNATEAAAYYEKGLHAAREARAPAMEENALIGLSAAYEQKKDGTKALFYFKQYIAVRDSLQEVKTAGEMADLKNQFEMAQKQGEIQTLHVVGAQQENEIKKSQVYIQKQGQFIVLIALVLVLAVGLTVAVFWQYRSKKKTNETLLQQNNQITEQKKGLETNLAYINQLKGALEEDLDRYMQMALRKQMNPHFIFNSLNSIQSFILQNDKLSANIYLSKFAGLMRKVLDNSQHEFIPLGQELEVLKLYVELEEQRFDNTFKCVWELEDDEELMQQPIPPLILQPYVENAIWHGLLHKESDRALLIKVIKERGQIQCVIQDNDIGRKAAMEMRKHTTPGGSLGMKITQRRIEILNSLNNSEIGVRYDDLTDNGGNATGTRVVLTLPLIEEQE